MIKYVPVNDLKIEELSVFTELNEAQLLHFFEPDGGIFIAESPKVIERALDFGCRPISVLMDEKRTEHSEEAALLKRLEDMDDNISVFTAPEEILKDITGFHLTRGMLCAIHRPELKDPWDMIKNCRRIAVLENVVNPTNIGAIFRSAAALNIDAILLAPGCCDPLTRRAIRVSMGNVFLLPWTWITSPKNAENLWPERGLEMLRENDFTSVALALREDSLPLSAPILKEYDKLAILLGNEGHGLSDETIASCDHTVIIPMAHEVDSLNVAAASAVAFWELTQVHDS